MFSKIRETQKSEKGFTLVELLVVIIIIGILAAVAIPAFLNQRQRANDAAVISDVKNVATQVESALVENPNARIVSSGPSSSPNSFQTGVVYVYVGNTQPTSSITSANSTFSVNLTDGVIIRVRPGTGAQGGYIIAGQHTNGKIYTGLEYLKYDSVQGGLQPGTTQGA